MTFPTEGLRTCVTGADTRGGIARAVELSVGSATVARVNPNLDALIAEATVDCYGEEEQLTGLFTMIDEYVAVPFRTTVLGAPVTVEEVELTEDGRIVARCVRDDLEQRISLLDLPLSDPAPDGAEWVDAYRRWAGATGR